MHLCRFVCLSPKQHYSKTTDKISMKIYRMIGHPGTSQLDFEVKVTVTRGQKVNIAFCE